MPNIKPDLCQEADVWPVPHALSAAELGSAVSEIWSKAGSSDGGQGGYGGYGLSLAVGFCRLCKVVNGYPPVI